MRCAGPSTPSEGQDDGAGGRRGAADLFRTVTDRAGQSLTRKALYQQDVYRMIRRRAAAAGIKTEIG
jgi:hypothetical protein